MDPASCHALPTYVQIAAGSTFDGEALALLGLAPATVFVIDGDDSRVGHLPTGVFLDHWYADDSGPGVRAVPAVLSLLYPSRPSSSQASLLLSLPRIRGAGLEYRAEVVAGDVGATSGACVLFLRPLATPLTPTDPARSPLSQRPRRRAAEVSAKRSTPG